MHSVQGWARNSSFLSWVALCCLLTGGNGAGVGAFAQGRDLALPDGKDVGKVSQRCGICHGIAIVAQQRLDRSEWTRVVDQMIEFGAALTPDERRDIVDYLVSYLGPEKRGD